VDSHIPEPVTAPLTIIARSLSKSHVPRGPVLCVRGGRAEVRYGVPVLRDEACARTSNPRCAGAPIEKGRSAKRKREKKKK